MHLRTALWYASNEQFRVDANGAFTTAILDLTASFSGFHHGSISYRQLALQNDKLSTQASLLSFEPASRFTPFTMIRNLPTADDVIVLHWRLLR